MPSRNFNAVGMHAPGGAFTLGVQSAGFSVMMALGGRSSFGTDTHLINFPDVPCHGVDWPLEVLADDVIDLVYSSPAPGERHEHACFVAGTQILTTRGPKPIEQIRKGELVMTYRSDRFQMVTATMQRVHTGPLVDVSVGMGPCFTCTPEHPVCVGFVGGSAPSTFIPAQECDGKNGWRPQATSISDPLVVTVRSPKGGVTVYNLSVEEDECYVAGGLLVHNCTQAVQTALTLRPRAFVLEGSSDWLEPRSKKDGFVARHKQGQAWARFWRDAGYRVSVVRCNAAQFGLPQSRERAFIVAAEGNLDFNSVTLPEELPSAASVQEAISDLVAQRLEGDPQEPVAYAGPATNAYQIFARRAADGRRMNSHLTWHVESPGAPSIMGVLPHLKQGQRASKLSAAILNKTYWKDREKSVVRGGKGLPSIYYRRLHAERRAPALPGDIRFVHPELDRFLTPREAARLMGLPDWFVFAGISATHANLEAGRTVCPRVVELVARHVMFALDNPNHYEHVEKVDLTKRVPELVEAEAE